MRALLDDAGEHPKLQQRAIEFAVEARLAESRFEVGDAHDIAPDRVERLRRGARSAGASAGRRGRPTPGATPPRGARPRRRRPPHRPRRSGPRSPVLGLIDASSTRFRRSWSRSPRRYRRARHRNTICPSGCARDAREVRLCHHMSLDDCRVDRLTAALAGLVRLPPGAVVENHRPRCDAQTPAHAGAVRPHGRRPARRPSSRCATATASR